MTQLIFFSAVFHEKALIVKVPSLCHIRVTKVMDYEDEPAWYDDPCFDTFEEMIDGRLVKGDAWRREMFLRERANAPCGEGTDVKISPLPSKSESLERCLPLPRAGNKGAPAPS